VSRVEVEADGPVRVSVERALSLSTGREVAGAASSRGGRVELGLPRELDRFWTVVVRGEGAALRSVRACDAAGKVVWAARLGPLKVLPGSLASRLAEQDWSLWLRLRYARDCLELWRRRPMFGWGFGGWASSYPSVQRFMYFTSDAHSPFLQAGAEGGLLGFAGYLALWVLGIAGWLRGRRGEPAAPGAFGALACLLSYGAFDLALNLPEVVAGYLPLLAAGSGFLRDSGRRVPGRRPVLPLVCLLLCAYSVLSLAGQLELWRAQGLASAGRPLDARAHAVLAARLLPLDARAHAAAAAGEALVVPVDPSRAESAWRHWSLALALDRADPELRERAGWFLVRLGDPEGGLELLEEAVRLGPFRVAAYEGLAAGYAYSGFLLAERDPDRAREFLERAVGVRARYESVRARQPEWVPPEWRLPAGTSALWLAAGEAGVLLGRAEEVRDCLERVMEDRGLAGPAAVFLAVGFPREAEGWLSVARAYAPRADALFEEACRVAAFLDLAGEGVRR
jgi:tetratricopeptide (TPR) repeat protein